MRKRREKGKREEEGDVKNNAFPAHRESVTGGLQLVATGSLLNVNPDRTVLKRIRLTGRPYKLNKKVAVIHRMFYNPDDINWFKPVELVTKFGRRGHIRVGLA